MIFTPNKKSVFRRLIAEERLCLEWEDVAERFYGSSVAAKLRALTPGDPFLLYDWCGVKLIAAGVAKSEVAEKLSSYTLRQWEKECRELNAMIVRSRAEADADRQ